ncbi:MAG: prepilin-type N-terminal cleavage/methylation domain-containing protein [Polaromonas sp.]|nr:prepilin-type N-terminal cleavage/methylation domain-containing protein [Polaromonas sp.]
MHIIAPQARARRERGCTVGTCFRVRGFTLIEILVTLAIILIGILGTFGLQTKATKVEFESYQRGQALALVRDMEARLTASRGIIDSFLAAELSSTNGSVYVGVGSGGLNGVLDCSVEATLAKTQLCAWGDALQGTAVSEGGKSVGAMIGARGCLIRMEPPQSNSLADLYIVVVWQGVVAGNDPPVDAVSGQNNCASQVNFGTGLRRGVSMRVMVPDLKKTL